MSQDRIFLNGIKKLKGLQYNAVSMSIKVDEFIEELKANQNDRGYVNILIKERKQADKFGNDRFAEVDTWKPNAAAQTGNSKTDDLPF
jgi:hypothetical protein